MNNLKEILSNNKGTLSLISFPLVILIILLGLALLSKSLQEYKLLKFRSNAYLCTKVFVRSTQNLSDRLHKLNLALAALPMILLTPAASSYLKLKKSLIQLGNILIILHTSKLLSNDKCTKMNKAIFMKSKPFFGKLKAKRNGLGIIKLRKKWKTKILYTPHKVLNPLENLFYIELNFQKKDLSLKASSKEINTKALQQLKHYYGLGSYVL